MVMNKVNFHPNIWTSVPYASQVLVDWYRPNALVKDLVLQNTELKSLGVSKLDLTITKMALIDQEQNEQELESFNTSNLPKTVSFINGSSIKLANVKQLRTGDYVQLRLYLAKNENGFTYSNGETESVSAIHYLDFKIENNLEIVKGANFQINFWFQLTPFHFGRHFKPVMDGFHKLKAHLPRFAGTMSS